MYKFKKNYTISGATFYKGVSFKGPYIISEDCVSVVGSNLLKNIPLNCLEYVNVVVMKRAKKKVVKEKIEPKSGAASSRVSTNKDALKKT